MVQHEQVMLLEMLKESIQGGSAPGLTVISSSMSPLLRSGDQVGLQELDPSEASLSQIITFINPSDGTQLVTHRVAGIAGEPGAVKQPLLAITLCYLILLLLMNILCIRASSMKKDSKALFGALRALENYASQS